MIVNKMSHVLSLLDDYQTDVAMWKSPQYNPMFTRGLNYIFHVYTFYGVYATRACQRYVTRTVITWRP